MTYKGEKAARQQVGEEVVSVFVKQALLAGATLEQLEVETGCSRDELTRLLQTLDRLEELLSEN